MSLDANRSPETSDGQEITRPAQLPETVCREHQQNGGLVSRGRIADGGSGRHTGHRSSGWAEGPPEPDRDCRAGGSRVS